jgi:hypothetical protein
VKEQFHTLVKQQTKLVLYAAILGHVMAQLVEASRYKQEVAGLIPEGVTGIFHWHNPSGHTMAVELIQPLREKSTRNISWG